jgi:hypothetical protein
MVQTIHSEDPDRLIIVDGIVDSRRADVKYEDFEGHHLDRKLLDLLLEF